MGLNASEGRQANAAMADADVGACEGTVPEVNIDLEDPRRLKEMVEQSLQSMRMSFLNHEKVIVEAMRVLSWQAGEAWRWMPELFQ